MYYGYRCYNKDREALGWLYTAVSEQELNAIAKEDFLVWCKRWKTKRGAEKNFDYYNQRWHYKSDGGYLQIEQMPELETHQLKDYRETKKRWDKQNVDKVKESKAKYDADNPVWSIRFKDEDGNVLEWLNEERWDNESNQELLMRKLRKLMNLENQGY
ncbi:MAG: hypothetical protein KA714_30660 [Limnoraphis sp. WC205]|jgi:hypothetical protein|nr:hypothetical protein [Limnoraphis sp. WC205]